MEQVTKAVDGLFRNALGFFRKNTSIASYFLQKMQSRRRTALNDDEKSDSFSRYVPVTKYNSPL